MNVHQQLEGNQNRRMASEARMLKSWDAMSAREDEAEALLGQLMVEGKTVYYVNTRSGKIKEGRRLELIAFLIRNNYV